VNLGGEVEEATVDALEIVVCLERKSVQLLIDGADPFADQLDLRHHRVGDDVEVPSHYSEALIDGGKPLLEVRAQLRIHSRSLFCGRHLRQVSPIPDGPAHHRLGASSPAGVR